MLSYSNISHRFDKIDNLYLIYLYRTSLFGFRFHGHRSIKNNKIRPIYDEGTRAVHIVPTSIGREIHALRQRHTQVRESALNINRK